MTVHSCVASALLIAAASIGGCTHTVKVEPIEIKPIYINVDVRIRLERELDDFFSYQDEPSTAATTTAPTAETEN